MKNNNSLNIFLLLLFVIAAVESAVSTASNPVCPSKATLQLQFSTPAMLTFDQTSFYYSADAYDSVGLFVANGGGTANFKFSKYDTSFSAITGQKFCDQTSAATFDFVALINQVLVVKDKLNPDLYYACKYDQTTASPLPRVKLGFPGNIPTPALMIPYYWDSVNNWLMVAISSGSQGGHYKYVWPATPTSSDTISADQRGTLVNNQYTQMAGTGYLFYNTAQSQIYTYQVTDYASAAANFPISAGQIVKVYPLRNKFCGVTILDSTLFGGKGYFVNQITIDTTLTLGTKSRSYDVYTQGVSNFVIVSDSYFFWGNVDPSGASRTKTLTTNDIDTTNLRYMGLSGNKAVLLYDAKIDYYQLDTDIKFLFTKTVSSPFTAQGLYKFGLSCLCLGVKRFSCFSSTLNCVIVKKAGQNCGTVDDLTP